MPRARINADGIAIAKEGYDVDTASRANMVFAPDHVAARVFMSGTVTVASFGGFMSDQYRMASVSFGKTFPHPPIVLVAGLLGAGGADISPAIWLQVPSGTGTARSMPYYSIVTTTTSFQLYVLRPTEASTGDPLGGSAATQWRYWVLENTLDT